VVRTIGRGHGKFAAAILDVSQVDDIDDAARQLLLGASAALRGGGRAGYLADPGGLLDGADAPSDILHYATVEEAVEAADAALRPNGI
jgi:glutaminase